MALVLTVLLFGSGIWIGNYLASYRIDDVVNAEQELRTNLIALNLQSELLEGELCNVDINELTEGKFEMGRKIEALESQKGYSDPEIMQLKSMYSLLSIQQYLLVKKQNEQCGFSVEPILFFYDNVNQLGSSQTQGYILDYVYEKTDGAVAIFALSVDASNPAVESLMKLYDVDREDAPVVIIKGETYLGVITSEEILFLIG